MLNKLIEKLEPPSPKELGWSDFNALGMRFFSPHTDGYTWEDWEEYVAEHYPVRNKFRLLFRWFGQKKYNMGERWYKFKSRFFKKQHLVDCRQGYNGYDHYEYGYCDPVEKLLYANFNILKEFVEKEEPKRPEEFTGNPFGFDKDQEKQWADGWKHASSEIYDLYDYWVNRRGAKNKEIQENFKGRRDIEDEEEYKKSTDAWLAARDAFEKEEQDNLERLIKVRKYMWT